MKRSHQLLFTCTMAVALASLTSHATIWWLKIRLKAVDYGRFGDADKPVGLFLAGSSLAFHGLDWRQIAPSIDTAIETRTAAGSSPSEWDVLARQGSEPFGVIAVVSAYDLNEFCLCDFRGEIVPFATTVRDLWQSHAGWAFSKRTLSQYPLALTRKLFPTAGRSGGVMVGLRSKLRDVMRFGAAVQADQGPRLGVDDNAAVAEKLSEWSADRLQRRSALMRAAFQGRHSFQGPKRLALMRLVDMAVQTGHATLVVLPVSPFYQREFLSPEIMRELEASLASVEREFPAARVIRLDQVDELQQDALFSDFVHLNRDGQQIASSALLVRLISDHGTQ